MPPACLSACHDSLQYGCEPAQLYRINFHSSHVDEFPAAHTGMADAAGKERSYQRHFELASSAHEKTGVINSILNFLHLPALRIINTPYAIVLGMVYNFLPFMVLPIYNALSKIDRSIIHAAKDLGANNIQVFFKITLPLSVPGIISGITMVFIPALTTFVISKLLGGSKVLLIGNVIEEEFTQASNWHLGSGLSIVLMLFIIVNMVLSAIFDKDGEGSFL